MCEIVPLIEQGRPTFAVAVASPASPLLQVTAQEIAGYFKARFGSSPPVLSVHPPRCLRTNGGFFS